MIDEACPFPGIMLEWKEHPGERISCNPQRARALSCSQEGLQHPGRQSIAEEETLMMSRAPILLTLSVLLAFAVIGCNTGGSTADLESTIAARVVATLEAAETAPAATADLESTVIARVVTTLEAAETAPAITPDLESTIVALLVATQEAAETAWAATPVPPEPTAVPVPTGPTVTPPLEIEAEEYAVYSAMIEQNPIGFDLGSFLVIKDQTLSGLDMFEDALEERGPLSARLVDSYRSRNAASYTLDRKLDLEQEYALMPKEEVDEIFRRGGATWTDFEAKYPEAEGIVIFSRVGFGANEDQALVEMGFRCGDLCGSGGLYLLAKEDGAWKIEEALMVWIS
jgi:hypothetical protein